MLGVSRMPIFLSRLSCLRPIVVVAVLNACAPAGARSFVVLADSLVQFDTAATTFRPPEPLNAADDENGICILARTGDTLNVDWTLPGTTGAPVALRAEALLTDGSSVALRPTAWMDGLCLHPARQGPWASAVREVRVWASGPIVAERVTWISTHK